MRFLANENFPGQAVAELRSRGHDVGWVRTDSPGAPDTKVLARAKAEDRILLTFDKDFGELAFRDRLPASCGIVLFRIAMPNPQTAAVRIAGVIESRTDWVGNFAVVDDARVRIRRLP